MNKRTLSTILISSALYMTPFNKIINSANNKFENLLEERYKNKTELFKPALDTISIYSVLQLAEKAENKLNIKFDNINFQMYDTLQSNGGFYNISLDMITLNKNGLFSHTSRNELNLFDKLFINTRSTNGVILHELGHDYTYQKLNDLDKKKLYDKNHNFFVSSILLEGIAEYFAMELGELKPKKIKPTSSNFIFDENYNYRYGITIIKPILDKYGVEEGIEKIFSSAPPKLEDFPDLREYQKRILKQ